MWVESTRSASKPSADAIRASHLHLRQGLQVSEDMDALTTEAEKVRLMREEKHSPTFLEPLPSRSDSRSSERTLLNMSDNDEIEKRKSADLEKEGVDGVEGQLPTIVTKDHVTEDPLARIKLLWWMFINTVATVMIVSILILRGGKTATARTTCWPYLCLHLILTTHCASTGLLQ